MIPLLQLHSSVKNEEQNDNHLDYQRSNKRTEEKKATRDRREKGSHSLELINVSHPFYLSRCCFGLCVATVLVQTAASCCFKLDQVGSMASVLELFCPSLTPLLHREEIGRKNPFLTQSPTDRQRHSQGFVRQHPKQK